MDLVSREETLSLEEAKDLGLETSLMIMTAREIVRKGEALTSTVKVSPEELRAIIRQVFRFPGPRSDSPLSDITAAEPADHRSSPIAEKTELPTVPEHGENEPVTISASASLSSPLPRGTESAAPAPTIATPIPPFSAPPPPNKQASSKPTSQKKEEVKPAPVNPQKEEPKPKEEPVTPVTFPKKKEESKPITQEPVQPPTGEPQKTEAQGDKKPVLSRLADAAKAAGSSNSAKDAANPKDKDGDKPADNKEAKDAKDKANTKDIAGPPADPNGTPVNTPLLNQESDRPGTPSTGQSVTIRCSVRQRC